VGSRFVYGRLQGGQVFLDDIPDQIEVDTKILVSQDVSGAAICVQGMVGCSALKRSVPKSLTACECGHEI